MDYGKLNNKRLMYFSAWIMKKRMTMTVKEFEGVSIHEALIEYEKDNKAYLIKFDDEPDGNGDVYAKGCINLNDKREVGE